jgi:plastocyanin
MKYRILLIAAAAALCLVPLMGAEGGSVTGTITAKGLRSSADIVVSLQAPGLSVTPPAKSPEMDQKGMRFIPHVLPIVTGTTVKFLNSDPFAHNVFSPDGRYNLGTLPFIWTASLRRSPWWGPGRRGSHALMISHSSDMT